MRMSEDSYHFTWCHHHLIMDGWSAMRITGEVFALYEGFAGGEELQLPNTLAYRDYIAWLREQDLKEAESFWRQTLTGFTSPTPSRWADFCSSQTRLRVTRATSPDHVNTRPGDVSPRAPVDDEHALAGCVGIVA
jgi:hypothetical protein